MSEKDYKMVFTYQYDSQSPHVEVLLPVDCSLDEVLETFQSFLYIIGYAACLEGKRLELVDDEGFN